MASPWRRSSGMRELSSDLGGWKHHHRLAGFAEHLIDAAAVTIVAYGVIEAFVHLLGIMARPGPAMANGRRCGAVGGRCCSG